MRFLEWLREHFIPTQGNAYRPRLLHRPWLLFFLALILATEGFLVASLVAQQTDQTFLAAVVPAEIIALTNTQREQNNVGQLTENAQLDQAAQEKAQDMAANNYFAHVGPDGKTPWQWIAGAGYSYQYAGENLAVRFVDSQDVVNAWMASPTHRANIVQANYTQVGVGVAEGLYQGESATYVVQYFATPLAATAPAAVAAAPAAAQTNSFARSLTERLTRAFSNPKQTADEILALCAALLIIVLALTFFMHIHLQHGGMLMQGVVVAAFAVSFLALNTHLNAAIAPGGQTQTANASEAALQSGVLIDSQAAAAGYALFPQ